MTKPKAILFIALGNNRSDYQFDWGSLSYVVIWET